MATVLRGGYHGRRGVGGLEIMLIGLGGRSAASSPSLAVSDLRLPPPPRLQDRVRSRTLHGSGLGLAPSLGEARRPAYKDGGEDQDILISVNSGTQELYLLDLYGKIDVSTRSALAIGKLEVGLG